MRCLAREGARKYKSSDFNFIYSSQYLLIATKQTNNKYMVDPNRREVLGLITMCLYFVCICGYEKVVSNIGDEH